MTQILIVDDERNIVELIDLYVKQAGYRTLHAHDGPTALRMVETHKPDLIVLDLMLPGLDGWDVCKRVRANSDTPIIMLTARDDAVDKIIGLELGADDYLTKPFNPRELTARIKAILRRTAGPPRASRRHVLGRAVIDIDSRTLTINDTPVRLRAREFDLLLTLAENKGMVLTRDQLLAQVWGYDFAGETRTVDVHVAQLRKHLTGSGVEIETMVGVGYKLNVTA
jgi:two-component system, OmpR family, alkaline phosphatase synthesis response regulator PhoP